MSALPGSFEGTAVTGLDSSPVEPAAPDLPLLTAQHEAEAAEIMARYPQARSALLPMLHLVQSVQGYVSPEGVGFCARLLGLTKAEVGAVATFYTMYKRHPTGRHLVSVCTNTLCAVLGGQRIYDAVSADLGVGHDQTAADGSVTLEHAECLAACDYAPVVTVDYEFYDQQDVDSARELVAALRRGEKPPPTRGAPLTDFRGVSRQLAGLSQHADAAAERAAVDAPSAGVPTLVGVRLAAERGEAAPPIGRAPDPGADAGTPAPEAPSSGGTGAERAGDATVAAATNPAEKAGAEQVHTDAPEPAGRRPAERGAEGTDTPPTGSGAGTNSSVEREV
ncbi:NADH-quinone oxidoreductase subunit NuoE [Modestobacter versicolor]|uniref:NADH-quinone oxidoreductase subunit E n=1 Tax=Modestobacter versicolor TaxID=429133 RepID=A0A323VB66_9ACTN|nr:NADH-quinone oxidoreductase subunit NuoE [Modestobacter versicolor]MBB3678014.1 NADH-quinone oxidoreductase subunit E [Modestobacter versicolor]PZA21420.1 NADH-quinone oxidoreductase subunit NuoE [Modestobacter versicolor]